MMVKVKAVTKPVELGEGPHWHVATQALYYIDLYGSSIHKYIPNEEKHISVNIGIVNNNRAMIPSLFLSAKLSNEQERPYIFSMSGFDDNGQWNTALLSYCSEKKQYDSGMGKLIERKESYIYVSQEKGDKPVTFVLPLENHNDKFLVSYGGDLGIVTWDGISKKASSFKMIHTLESYPEIRMNDAKVSPSGVLFLGSMGSQHPDKSYPTDKGTLYAIKDSKVKTLLTNVGISNGLAWSLNEDTLYYIDTSANKIYAFDYDAKNINITNQRTFLDFTIRKLPGAPDGMAIDTDGNLWVACIHGSKVLKLNSKTAEIISTVDFPCSEITSVAFGGSNLDHIYVTTAYYDVPQEEKERKPLSGCLFRVTGTGSKGFPGVSVPESILKIS